MDELTQGFRRVAHWQSASIHTEGVAAFESCPAYQTSSRAGLLFLSHCVPNPPDKGEKIRAHHELMYCAERWPVHLVCFARTQREVEEAQALRSVCASVHVELLQKPGALAKGALRFAAGASLTMSFYHSARLQAHIESLAANTPLFATFAYSSAMGQYAPARLPVVLDFVDVDSEKWFQFSETRYPSWLYRTEGRRLRAQETLQHKGAVRTYVTTVQEASVLASFAGGSNGAIESLENGVDSKYFDPRIVNAAQSNPGERVVVFVGAMDYYPNVDAVCWFAENVLPAWRKRCPQAAFWIVGRNPSKRVRSLAQMDGIRVTGAVDDVRPYFARAEVVIASMRIARGIQNKVLEALSMGKRVLASSEVARCFGSEIPLGLSACASPEEYLKGLPQLGEGEAFLSNDANAWDPRIRDAAATRFSWEANLNRLDDVLSPLALAQPAVAS
jgi:polysaccharide biosynthesis protein PslH